MNDVAMNDSKQQLGWGETFAVAFGAGVFVLDFGQAAFFAGINVWGEPNDTTFLKCVLLLIGVTILAAFAAFLLFGIPERRLCSRRLKGPQPSPAPPSNLLSNVIEFGVYSCKIQARIWYALLVLAIAVGVVWAGAEWLLGMNIGPDPAWFVETVPGRWVVVAIQVMKPLLGLILSFVTFPNGSQRKSRIENADGSELMAAPI
jgi:hypothetical protein